MSLDSFGASTRPLRRNLCRRRKQILILTFAMTLPQVALFSKILVALDGSEYSVKALEFAIDLAKKYQSQLVLIHVVIRQIYAINPPEAGILAGTAIVRELETEGKAILARGEEAAKAQGVSVETRLKQGVPAEELLHAVADEKVDLIVLGSRGLSQVKAFLLGSVSDKVSHHAKCSALIVR